MAKHSKTLISCITVLSLILGPLGISAIAATQEEIDAVRSRRDAISAERQKQQALVDELTRRQASVIEQKAAMDERSALTGEQIELLREEIALCVKQIEEKRLEVVKTLTLEAAQRSRYRARVRAMEENGRLSLLTLVLMTDNLGEFFTAADDMGEIMQYDRSVEDDYRRSREASERAQAEYEEAKAQLESRESELAAEQAVLQSEIDEAAALIARLEADIENGQAEVEAILRSERETDAELTRLVAELERQRQEELERRRREEEQRLREEELRREAEEQRRLEQLPDPTLASEGNAFGAAPEEEPESEPARGAVQGTGAFVWPVPGHTYITSRFGLRIHPITGQKKSHTGLDISAEAGTTIVAADSGTVTKAAVYGGYGNCVILDHGNGYVTLYGHMSLIAVSEGDTVSQGQTIGAVGSTGLSTGPHCHFEIWSGGARIDPESFFSGLSFSDSAGE